jgi:hypothetical protein
MSVIFAENTERMANVPCGDNDDTVVNIGLEVKAAENTLYGWEAGRAGIIRRNEGRCRMA